MYTFLEMLLQSALANIWQVKLSRCKHSSLYQGKKYIKLSNCKMKHIHYWLDWYSLPQQNAYKKRDPLQQERRPRPFNHANGTRNSYIYDCVMICVGCTCWMGGKREGRWEVWMRVWEITVMGSHHSCDSSTAWRHANPPYIPANP